MTLTIDLVLIVAAVACFLLAAFGVATRIGLVPLGLALWALTAIV